MVAIQAPELDQIVLLRKERKVNSGRRGFFEVGDRPIALQGVEVLGGGSAAHLDGEA